MTTVAVPKFNKNFTNGELVEDRSGRWFENRNPANPAELTGIFPSSTQEDVNYAVEAAKGPRWNADKEGGRHHRRGDEKVSREPWPQSNRKNRCCDIGEAWLGF
jgi:hypothetical protein